MADDTGNDWDAWKETARQYAQNADYWRDRLNDHRASLAIQAFTAPDEDEAVMMESLVARIGDCIAERDVERAARERAEAEARQLREGVEKLVRWAESYRMHHTAIALRNLLASVAEVAEDRGQTGG